MPKLIKSSGFTLIELLVVIAIIGVLSTLAVIALGNARSKSRDAKRVADLKQISTALELYYADNGSYPVIITPGQAIKSPDGLTTYMANIPSNPTPRADGNCANSDYSYTVDSQSSPSNYNISTCLGSGTGSNTAGAIAYSNTGFFNCGQKVSDAGGKQYDTVQISSQCWMKENLAYLPSVNGVADGSTTDNKYYVYGYDGTDVAAAKAIPEYTTRGVLYNWPAAITSCPLGWHLPTDTEFNTLEKYVVALASSGPQYACGTPATAEGWRRCADDNGSDSGGANGAGKSLKKVGTPHNGIDLVGFSAMMVGYRDTGGSFVGLTSFAFIWQATESGASYGWYRYLSTTYSTVFRVADGKAYGFSVRCVKD